MSTYLVVLVVGPLVATDPIDVDGKPLRVVCPIGKEHLADYVLEVGAFALRFFSDWFGIVYPGDKLDLVAIPDFALGAMENPVASPSGSGTCWSTRPRRRRPSCRRWSMSSPTRSRTCGSATS